MSFRKKISVLGITGSVGRCAQDVVLAAPECFDVQVLTAGTNVQALAQSAIALKARKAIIADEGEYQNLKALLSGHDIEIEAGVRAIESAAGEPADLVLAAIVGFAGLRPIMSALKSGINVAIANKEPLVAAGSLIMRTARETGARIIPVDSEHNAIFQVFEAEHKNEIRSIILTASGGPFLRSSSAEMENASPAQAVRHPNWSMGAKISVDSATMMNKALEVIEAHYLFDMPPEHIEVIIHPQSIIHSMVRYSDGSVLAQMGVSDMRIPVAYALGWPARIASPAPKLDFTNAPSLTFELLDSHKFPAVTYAMESLRAGGGEACAALNAANEVAVSAFLEEKIKFGDIMRCVRALSETYFDKNTNSERITIEEIEDFDNMIRRRAAEYLEHGSFPQERKRHSP